MRPFGTLLHPAVQHERRRIDDGTTACEAAQRRHTANRYCRRGFDLDHETHQSTFIDGVPNNLRTHGHGQGYNDLNALISELIDTIESR